MAKLIATRNRKESDSETLQSRIIMAFASLTVAAIIYVMLIFLSWRLLSIHFFVVLMIVSFVGGFIGGTRFYNICLAVMSKVGDIWNWSLGRK